MNTKKKKDQTRPSPKAMPDMCLGCYVLIGNICYRLLDRFVDLPENEGRIKEDVNPHQQVLPILAVTTSALPLFN